MQISGRVEIAATPEQAIAALHQPALLERFLLGTAKVTQTGEGTYDFRIERETAIVTLRLPGKLTIAPVTGRPDTYALTATASQVLAGSVSLTLTIAYATGGKGTVAEYDGTLDSTGLARQLVKSKEASIPAIVGNLMRSHATMVQQQLQQARAAAKEAKAT